MSPKDERTFPRYTDRERRADAAILIAGLAAGLPAGLFLLFRVAVPWPGIDVRLAAAATYVAGLLAMFGFSAAYNLSTRPGRKEILRRCDHAAIFLMIAGTYTPFAAVGLGHAAGDVLLAAIWACAVVGIAIKWIWPRRLERLALALYLVMGWLALPLTGLLIDALAPPTLWLLLAGGICYTAGVAFHLWRALPFQNAVWHGCVLAGAAAHYVAVTRVLGG